MLRSHRKVCVVEKKDVYVGALIPLDASQPVAAHNTPCRSKTGSSITRTFDGHLSLKNRFVFSTPCVPELQAPSKPVIRVFPLPLYLCLPPRLWLFRRPSCSDARVVHENSCPKYASPRRKHGLSSAIRKSSSSGSNSAPNTPCIPLETPQDRAVYELISASGDGGSSEATVRDSGSRPETGRRPGSSRSARSVR